MKVTVLNVIPSFALGLHANARDSMSSPLSRWAYMKVTVTQCQPFEL